MDIQYNKRFEKYLETKLTFQKKNNLHDKSGETPTPKLTKKHFSNFCSVGPKLNGFTNTDYSCYYSVKFPSSDV